MVSTFFKLTHCQNFGMGTVSGCQIDQGIFVGNYDVYTQFLPGQWIILDSLPFHHMRVARHLQRRDLDFHAQCRAAVFFGYAGVVHVCGSAYSYADQRGAYRGQSQLSRQKICLNPFFRQQKSLDEAFFHILAKRHAVTSESTLVRTLAWVFLAVGV